MTARRVVAVVVVGTAVGYAASVAIVYVRAVIASGHRR